MIDTVDFRPRHQDLYPKFQKVFERPDPNRHPNSLAALQRELLRIIGKGGCVILEPKEKTEPYEILVVLENGDWDSVVSDPKQADCVRKAIAQVHDYWMLKAWGTNES